MADAAASSASQPQANAGPASSRHAVVACQGLTKVFNDFWLRPRVKAVQRLDMVVERGEIFGLLGPNGSGKSTTIKMVLGLLRPSSGRIAVFGKPPTDVRTKKRIGYLPEESYLYPFLNARETLDYYAKLFELDHRTRKARIDELLEMVGLTREQNRPVRDYSKGMQRRIGIAQALINDPDLLILDEPTTGLDPIGTRQVKDLIIELGRKGKTIILSSHLLADVEDVVDRMVILYGGKIRGEGTCEALLAKTQRTTIETDELDEDTIAEIDRIIRERSGGQRSVLGVSHPRQRLEELFLGIVETARRERAETAGAEGEGAIASFLSAEDADTPDDGEAVIDRLMTEDEPPADEASTKPAPTPETSEPSEPTTSHDTDLIGDLVKDEPAAPPPNQPKPSEPSPSQSAPSNPTPNQPSPPPERGDVDDSLIDSLIDEPEHDEGPGRRGPGGA